MCEPKVDLLALPAPPALAPTTSASKVAKALQDQLNKPALDKAATREQAVARPSPKFYRDLSFSWRLARRVTPDAGPKLSNDEGLPFP